MSSLGILNIIYRSKPDDLSIPPMITDPTERAYWNELVQQRGVMNAGDVRVHNYRMSVQEVPIIAGTVSLNNKIYNIWLLGNEAYCYAPELEPEFTNDFGYSSQEGISFYTNFLMEVTMGGSPFDLLNMFK